MWSRQFLQLAGERGPRSGEINILVLRRQKKKGDGESKPFPIAAAMN
jgi:hypothetical protein